MKPALSICVPTFNRAEHLKLSLESIVAQPFFLQTNEVEIVISDNCSTDSTERVALEFQARFPDKVLYNRNVENIKDGNFVKVLDLATGDFIKLANDTLVWKEDSLSQLVNEIKEHRELKPVLFFTNGNAPSKPRTSFCASLDEFISTVSYFSIWIACFGIWRIDYQALEDPLRAAELKLIQADILFRLLLEKRSAFVSYSVLFSVQEVQSKGGYNIHEVFGKNYIGMIETYCRAGHVSRVVYEREKRRLFFRFLVVWTAIVNGGNKKYSFDVTRWAKHWRYFRNNWYRFFLYPLAFLHQIRRRLPFAN